jgi:predicted ATP-grasp superfamily ATP-dependent carboligase
MDAVSADLPERLLLVSCAGRMLARSAARAGLRPVVLDLYADQDTRECAADFAQVPHGRIGFEAAGLLEAAGRLAPADGGFALVYGSGLDIAPDLLERLARGRKVYGNPPEIPRLLKTPATFFDLLRRLDIPYPEIRYRRPPDPQHWLIKSGCSEGGKGVRFCAQAEPDGDDYYQRRLPGKPLSALFLADGANARIIGFNTLWTARHLGQPFLFVGAVNRAGLSPIQRDRVEAFVARLVRAVGLKGLNSLDFMLDGETCRVLEINPRPSATMALYEGDFPEGLLARHIRACRGELGEPWEAGAKVRAFRAIFARRDVQVPEAMAWPEWCADRPVPGSSVAAGTPLCTVEAEGRDSREVEHSIRQREIELLNRLNPRTAG